MTGAVRRSANATTTASGLVTNASPLSGSTVPKNDRRVRPASCQSKTFRRYQSRDTEKRIIHSSNHHNLDLIQEKPSTKKQPTRNLKSAVVPPHRRNLKLDTSPHQEPTAGGMMSPHNLEIPHQFNPYNLGNKLLKHLGIERPLKYYHDTTLLQLTGTQPQPLH